MDYAYVGIAYACVLSCVCVRFLGVCRRVHLCAGAAHFSHFFCLLCLLPAVSCRYHTVPQALKLSLLCGSHGPAALPHRFCAEHYRLCVCAVCAIMQVRVRGRYMQLCAFVCRSLTFQLFELFALPTASAVSCLYHTVPEALELCTMWKPLYNKQQPHMSGALILLCVS